MKYKFIIGLIIGGLLLFGFQAQAQQMNLWKYVSGLFQPVVSTWSIYSPDDFRFDDEILPDGDLCANTQILKKTGADNWDCAADNNTTYLGGTNLTLVDTTFNVDNAFITNNAADIMSASVDTSTLLTIQNTDTTITTAGYLLELIHDANDDADADFLICQDDGAGTPDTLFSIASDGSIVVGGSLTSTFNDSLSIGGLTAGTVDMGAGNLADLFVSDDLEVNGMIYGDGGFTGTLTGSSTNVSCAECLIIGTEVKAGTLTDTKYCIWDTANSQIVCNSTPAGGGDVTDVFNCSTGDCASITMAATDLLNMSGTDASTTSEGLILPQHATACAGGTAEGQVCWEADANILHIGDGATIVDFVPTSAFSTDATVGTTGVVTIADSVAVTSWNLTTPTITTSIDLPTGAINTATEIAADIITHAQILDADQTDTKCIWFEDPTAVDDFKSIWRNSTGNDLTLTELWAESDQTVTFMLQVDDGTPADIDSVDLAPAAGEAEDTSLDGDTTLAQSEELDLAITSVSGTPTWVSICWTFQWND